MDISVIICTYNGQNRIGDCLKSISGQRLNNEVETEVIVVDNNSTEELDPFINSTWESLKNPFSIRTVTEKRAGLSYARYRGFNESQGKYIVFCDDDNHLNPDYFQLAYELMTGNEKIGILGGQGFLPKDLAIPQWFHHHQQAYAIGPQAMESGDITKKKGYVYGAGAVLRKSTWEKVLSCGFQHIMSDRSGKELSSGGDIEMCYALRLAGYSIWYDERLQFVHAIDPDRLNFDYLNQLQYRNGRGRIYLNLYPFVISKNTYIPMIKGWFYYFWHVYKYMLSFLKVVSWDHVRGNTLSSNRPAYKYYQGLFFGSLKAGMSYIRALDQIQRLKTCLQKDTIKG